MSNIAASGSLLMAIIVAEFSMPFVCWMAPEMPRAMYKSGFTWTPVTPT